MTLKEAKKRGWQVCRTVQYYAIAPDGIHYALYSDWFADIAYNWRKKPKKRKAA